MPVSTSFLAVDSTSSQVFGALSTPAFLKASLLYQSTGVELLKGIESNSPSGVW